MNAPPKVTPMMPTFSIPPEIFDRLRHDLRAQSGIPSYDPTDLPIPGLGACESCVAELDPSLPDSRCKTCKGRLLRGAGSILCVSCGEERFGDAMPDPINFRDSMGCAWLLEALGLDGSESVLPIFEENERYRGKKKVIREIRLSELLNLEIKQSVQEKEPAMDGKAVSAWSKSSLKLGGVDHNDLVTMGTSSAKAEKKQRDNEGNWVSESNIPHVPDNLSLFGNVPPSSTAGNSTEY